MFNKLLIVCLCLFGLMACKQSDPPPLEVEKGDLYFSGYYWNYKNKTSPAGPGPNIFLGNKQAAWVDSSGKLHLTIQKINNQWVCSEIISAKEFGYGTFVFSSETDISNFDERVVFGAFTWDDYSFQKQANSEIDVEFSKWNAPNDTLLVTYSVQPVWFSNPTPYQERSFKPKLARKWIKGPMTFAMKWTPDVVSWQNFSGLGFPGGNMISQWQFDKTNVSRSKLENNLVSDPIVIPAPSDSTNFRFNFWLLGGLPPNNSQRHEIIVSDFKFIPL